jgi:hypothetical protein
MVTCGLVYRGQTAWWIYTQAFGSAYLRLVCVRQSRLVGLIGREGHQLAASKYCNCLT